MGTRGRERQPGGGGEGESGDLKAFSVQASPQLLDVLRIARLHYAMNSYRGDVFIGECAVVRDVDHACAFLGDQSRESRETARTITNDGGESMQPAIERKATLEDAAQSC